MTPYKKFCILRDQRRAGEEAPEFTELEAFEAAVQQDTVDAARYRWLRDTDPQPERRLDVTDGDNFIFDGKNLDAAIDAAIARQYKNAKSSE